MRKRLAAFALAVFAFSTGLLGTVTTHHHPTTRLPPAMAEFLPPDIDGTVTSGISR